MTSHRPHSQTLRGAADNGSRMPGGGLRAVGDINGSIRCRRTYSKIARALLAAALFWAPLGAFAHVLPTSGDVGLLNAGGVKTPGSTDEVSK